MAAVRGFDLLLLVVLACLSGLGVTRWLALRVRGVRVLAVDRPRSSAQALTDLTQVICLLLWASCVISYAVPLSVQPPAWLGVILVDATWVKVLGELAALSGLFIYGLALRAFGDSWRLGIDRESPGALVTTGIFARTRNPIYLGLDLLIVGAFLVQGRLILLVLAFVNVALFHHLIRREEAFLTEVYGNAYRDYCKRVRRYVTWCAQGHPSAGRVDAVDE